MYNAQTNARSFPSNTTRSVKKYLFGFNADCITNLLVSFEVCCFGVVTTVFAVAVLMRELCRKIDDGAADVVMVAIGLSSSLQLLILTAPLFSKLSSSWPFCKMI